MAAPQLVKKTVTLTVEAVNARGKIWVVNTKVDDKPFVLKMFDGNYQKHLSAVKAGATLEAEIEQREDRDGKPEWFLCGPAGATGGFKGGGNRGGAPAKADPAKLKAMEEASLRKEEGIERASKRKDEGMRESNLRKCLTEITVASMGVLGDKAKDVNVLDGYVEDIWTKVIERRVDEALK